jgi:hypothetical protein
VEKKNVMVDMNKKLVKVDYTFFVDKIVYIKETSV